MQRARARLNRAWVRRTPSQTSARTTALHMRVVRFPGLGGARAALASAFSGNAADPGTRGQSSRPCGGWP
eukprot:8610634-Pyramimonas_sp.AAC.1